MPSYTLIADLGKQIQVSKDATLSKIIHHDGNLKVVLFAFGSGQELSKQTVSGLAILQILQGNARVTVASDEQELSAGSWLYMEAGVSHAIYARTDLIMLFTVLTGADPR